MQKITVVSMGPGSPDFLVPAAAKAIAGSEVLCGSTRLLAGLDTTGKELIFFGNDLEQTCREIRAFAGRRVAVLVSGDAGFHSFLNRLVQEWGREQLTVIPGISSPHYLLAALGFSWEETAFLSLHGRDADFIPVVKANRQTALLTDNHRTPHAIAALLVAHNMGALEMYIGSRLSYPDESIVHGTAEKIAQLEGNFEPAVVVVINE